MKQKILGIEFGSTRIKAVLIDENGKVLAVGSKKWENSLIDGYWSYGVDEIINGMQESFAELKKDYGKKLETLDAIGISGMMHGYFAFDKSWNLLAPFRTWRNTRTAEASKILTEELQFNVPQRWSCCHFYQAVLSGEKHVSQVAHLTTIAGFVNFILTGQNVLGANDASGMFPVVNNRYDAEKLLKYNNLLCEKGIKVKAEDIFPKVLLAGENAGELTPEGAFLLDPTGELNPGIPFCPPEGDMGTGMVATNSVSPATASVSCGTSANVTVVFQKPLSTYYPQIDVISTPNGNVGAIIHTNNCTCEIDYWVELFAQAAELFGVKVEKGDLFNKLFTVADQSGADVGLLTAYNFLAGETLANTEKGVPMLIHESGGKPNIADFMQAQIYGAVATLKLGTEILQKENIKIETVTGHGGYYQSGTAGQISTSALLNAPVSVYKTAGEGGAWGIAVLAAFMISGKKDLGDYLSDIFADFESKTLTASKAECDKFNNFFTRYKKFLAVEDFASKQ